MRRTLVTIAATAAGAAFLSSCSAAGESTTTSNAPSTTAARTTLTAPALQPPQQHNAQGRQDVVYDPCTYVDDATIQQAGFDPKSRKREGDFVGEYAFFSCVFASPERMLTVFSGNVPFEEAQQRYAGKSEAVTVGDRESLLIRDPELPGTCQLNMRTKVGIAGVLVQPKATAAVQPCDGIVDLATVIEPTIGQEN